MSGTHALIVAGAMIPRWAAVAALIIALSGCTPSDPPGRSLVAVRASGDLVEVSYVGCAPMDILTLALVLPSHPPEFREGDPPVWKIAFAPASRQTHFVIGETPTDATEEMKLAQPLARETFYVVLMTFPGGDYFTEAFTLKDLGKQVAFQNRYMSTEQFNKARRCP